MASYIKKKRRLLKNDKDLIYIEGYWPTEMDGNREWHMNRKKTFFNNDSIEMLKENSGHYTEKLIGIRKQQWRTKKR